MLILMRCCYVKVAVWMRVSAQPLVAVVHWKSEPSARMACLKTCKLAVAYLAGGSLANDDGNGACMCHWMAAPAWHHTARSRGSEELWQDSAFVLWVLLHSIHRGDTFQTDAVRLLHSLRAALAATASPAVRG
jgi:hypothetical protein